MSEDLEQARRDLEAALGLPEGSIGAARSTPGTVVHPNNEVTYIEVPGEADFDAFFIDIVEAVDPPRATGGSLMAENCALRTPRGDTFIAVTARGDLLGWRDHIATASKARNLRLARILDGEFVLESGDRFALEACEVWFYPLTQPRNPTRKSGSRKA